ncbi:MAG: AbrB/MazE/SpoVT family DNA-binding domain-containing protein [Alphaproteobacteria bacterium]
MRARLVRIGRSRAVRLPKAMIDQCGLGDEVEVNVDRGTVVISPVRRPREGWDTAFAAANRRSKDPVALPDHLDTGWDEHSWKW